MTDGKVGGLICAKLGRDKVLESIKIQLVDQSAFFETHVWDAAVMEGSRGETERLSEQRAL